MFGPCALSTKQDWRKDKGPIGQHPLSKQPILHCGVALNGLFPQSSSSEQTTSPEPFGLTPTELWGYCYLSKTPNSLAVCRLVLKFPKSLRLQIQPQLGQANKPGLTNYVLNRGFGQTKHDPSPFGSCWVNALLSAQKTAAPFNAGGRSHVSLYGIRPFGVMAKQPPVIYTPPSRPTKPGVQKSCCQILCHMCPFC